MNLLLLVIDYILCIGLGGWLTYNVREKLSVDDRYFDIKVAGLAVGIAIITAGTFYGIFSLILSIK